MYGFDHITAFSTMLLNFALLYSSDVTCVNMQNSTRTRRSIDTEQHTTLETNNVISSGIPSRRGFKVTVLGAAGGIGQPLCLLLKQYVLNCIYAHHILSFPMIAHLVTYVLFQRFFQYD